MRKLTGGYVRKNPKPPVRDRRSSQRHYSAMCWVEGKFDSTAKKWARMQETLSENL